MNTILILHGWGSGAKNWSRVKELLENQGCKVCLPDLPGFGENLPPSQPWSIDDYAAWVKEFSEKQNLSPFFLLGHSFGGRIAIKFAVKFPEKIEKLILISAAGLRQKKNLKDYLAIILAKIAKPFSFLPGFKIIRGLFYQKFLRKTDYLKAKGIMKEIFKEIIKEDLEPQLSRIKIKTLIIWGKKDKITPLKNGLKMKEKIKDSEIVILENVGHTPNLKVPQELSKAIIEFMNL